MEETIPAGAAVNQGRTTRTEADAATQLLQGGMLDDEVFESRSDTSHIKKNEEIEEKEVSEDDTEESDEEQPEEEKKRHWPHHPQHVRWSDNAWKRNKHAHKQAMQWTTQKMHKRQV